MQHNIFENAEDEYDNRNNIFNFFYVGNVDYNFDLNGAKYGPIFLPIRG